jgi:hypothetical protein
MALFDNIGGLLGSLGDYGFGVPSNTGGLVADAEREAINKRALLSGLINAGLTYAATPKNLNAGSPLPYLGRAALAGYNTSQDVVDRALNTAYRNQLLSAKDDKLYNVDGALVDKEGKIVYQSPAKQKEIKTQLIDVGNKKILIDEASGNPIKEFSVAKQPKEVNYTVQTDANGQAVYVPNVPGLPVLDQTGKAVSYKPAPTAAEAKVQEKQAQAKKLPTLINEAEGLLKEATGSYLGAARDIAAATVGQSTKGAQNIASLKGIEANLILSMPRLEGPQSNLDQQLYRQAAGQIGDPTVPTETKMAALKTIKRINTQYGENDMQNQPTQQTNVQVKTSTFKEGARTKSKSGKPMIFRNGQWEYE